MKNQKGFIQISIFIVIIVGALVLSGVGYFAVRQYKDFLKGKEQAQQQADAQQKALEQAQVEIEKLKTINEATQKKQDTLEKTIKSGQLKPQSISISASEINPYLSGVVEIICKDSAGSGSLWNIDSKKIVLTNEHVITDPLYSSLHKQSYCTVWVNDSSDSF